MTPELRPRVFVLERTITSEVSKGGHAPFHSRTDQGDHLLLVLQLALRRTHTHKAESESFTVFRARSTRDCAFVYRHYPMSASKSKHRWRQAAKAAGAQGRFWEMHGLLFQHQQATQRQDLERYATQLELDVGLFNRELKQGSTPRWSPHHPMLQSVGSISFESRIVLVHIRRPYTRRDGAPHSRREHNPRLR